MTLTQVDPPPSLDEFDLTNDLDQLYGLAKDKKQMYQSTWRRNYLLLTSRQNQASGTQPWSANVTDSEIFPIISSRIAWITDQKLQFDVAPAATPGSAFADHMNTLGTHLEQILDTNWQVQGWDKEVLLAIWDSALFGAGILKAVWDSGIDSGLGNAAMKRVDVWKFYPDPNATSIDDCDYMFEVKRMSYAEIERKFPTTSAALIQEALQHGDAADPSMTRPDYAPTSDYPMANPGTLQDLLRRSSVCRGKAEGRRRTRPSKTACGSKRPGSGRTSTKLVKRQTPSTAKRKRSSMTSGVWLSTPGTPFSWMSSQSTCGSTTATLRTVRRRRARGVLAHSDCQSPGSLPDCH